jgi:hypothetical protein
VNGTVYPLHLEPGPPITGARVARHYLGFTECEVKDRVAQHLAGRGSPPGAAVIAACGTVTVERAWSVVDRNFERVRKRRHETPRLYPPAAAAPVRATDAACCPSGCRR